jgi:hypothetical protein
MFLTIFAALSLSLAANPACTGKLSGAVTGSFECDVSIVKNEEGQAFLVIAGRGPIENVPSYVPGSFEVTGLLRPGTYTLDQLGGGRASVAAENRTLYTATRTTGQRGEVTLVLKSVGEDPERKGGYRVHGSYRARLLPAGGGKSGEVIVEVEF